MPKKRPRTRQEESVCRETGRWRRGSGLPGDSGEGQKNSNEDGTTPEHGMSRERERDVKERK